MRTYSSVFCDTFRIEIDVKPDSPTGWDVVLRIYSGDPALHSHISLFMKDLRDLTNFVDSINSAYNKVKYAYK